jgi:serine/threonine-protein kinase
MPEDPRPDAVPAPTVLEGRSGAGAGPRSFEIPESFLADPANLTLPSFAGGEAGDKPLFPPPSGNERYVVEAVLGRGGMASVYRAFDRQLERRVALKLLERPLRGTAEPFLREARAQARVRHDNVLEVYESGEIDGRPYIAMRYVEGPTLRELDDLPLEAKLRLLAGVAEGLHAAHRAGLLHRDVKPSNVLVEFLADGDMKPYVADFGIATALEGDLLGAVGLVGTPAYMAPERLRDGVVDRRSDVYSLGVTACQTLTGELPQLGRPIEPLLTELPADVAAIVRKCVAADPDARYPSARAVAEELRRYLDGEVVEAHAATWAYRLTKFATRHRRLLSLAGVAAVLLTAALAVAAGMGVVAMRANARAEARRGQAEDLIGFMLGDLREKLEPSSRLEVLDGVGKKALDYFAAVPREELSAVELSRRARALYQIGDVRIRQGDLEGARRPLDESLALAEELVRRAPSAKDPLYELGQSRFWVGYVAWKQGRLDDAARRFEEYLEVSRTLLALEPANPDYRLEVHYATSNLGSVREARGELAAAIEAFREALASISGLSQGDPSRGDWRFELAAAHNSLAVPLQATGHYEEALEHYRADLAIRRELLAADPTNRRGREFLGVSETYLSIALLPLGRVVEALDAAVASVRRLEDLVAEDAQHAVRRYKLANAQLQLGRAHLAAADRAAAARAFERSREILAALVEQDATNESWQRQLGRVLYHRALANERPDTALVDAEQSLAVFAAESSGPADTRKRAWSASTWLLVGELRAAVKDPRGAREAYEQALAALGPEAASSQDLELLATWARTASRLGRVAESQRSRDTLATSGYRDVGFADPVALEIGGRPAPSGRDAS